MRKIPACREIIRLVTLGYSDKKISEITGSTRKTVKKIKVQAHSMNISWPLDLFLDDERLYFWMFPEKPRKRVKKQPEYTLYKPCALKGENRKKLYEQYLRNGGEEAKDVIGYKHFCKTMKKEIEDKQITSDRTLKPGKIANIFWMEQSYDLASNNPKKAYVFFGILPYSQHIYIKAFKDRGIKTWVNANSMMLHSIGGVPEKIIVSGTKTGVSKRHIDEQYKELIEYYGTIVTDEQDGRDYELEVLNIKNWFEQKILGLKCLSIEHLNLELDILSKEFLNKVVRSRTRLEAFTFDEKPCLRALPSDMFFAIVRKTAKIQRNCHIAFEKRYYSVPYQYLLKNRTTVELEVTSEKISIYYGDNIIAEHPNMKDSFQGTYSTKLAHMPSDVEEALLEWNREAFLKRADRAGKNTHRVIEELMDSKHIRQQTYRVCDMILRLGTEYTYSRLEAVCAKIKHVRNGTVYKTIEEGLKLLNNK